MTLPRITRVQHLVAEHYGITVEDLRGPQFTKTFAEARRVALYLCRVHLDPQPSLMEIARAFCRNDHSGIIRGIKSVTARMVRDRAFRETIESFARALGSAPTGAPDLSAFNGLRKIETDPTWEGRVA